MPYPPTANHYVKHTRSGQHYKTDEAHAFERAAWYAVKQGKFKAFPGDARLAVEIAVFPPDRRRRDIANLEKVTTDSLQRAGLFPDDEAIDDLRLVRHHEPRIPGGQVVVTITEL